MILIDTHIWVWWVDNPSHLPSKYRDYLEKHEPDGFGLSIISVWEVAKLYELNRLVFSVDVNHWIEAALIYPGIRLLEITPQIAVESTQLPGTFHRDPADQIIVATARVHDISLMTVDEKILAYPHVKLAP